MQPLGFLSVALGFWCLYCAAHSFNPVTMLPAVLKSPSDAPALISAAESAVASSTAKSEASKLEGETPAQIQAQLSTPHWAVATAPGSVQLGTATGTKDGFPVYGTVDMGPFTGDPISNTFAQHVARGSTAPGIDFAIPAGTPLETPFAGKVSYTPLSDPESGNTISVKLSNGDVLSMRHVEGVVSSLVGKTVPAGTVIGYSGGVAGLPGSGDSTGPHVHVDLRTTAGQYVPFYDLLSQQKASSV